MGPVDGKQSHRCKECIGHLITRQFNTPLEDILKIGDSIVEYLTFIQTTFCPGRACAS